jgi:ribosomal protein L12E/L44/L45/RPP1/RPP2
MATTKSTTKAAVETAEQTPLEIVNAGIMQVIEAHGIDIQKARYKAMRAIAWQAFIESIETGDFEELVNRASGNVDDLPAGWELTAQHKPAAKAASAKKAPAKDGSGNR